MLRSGRVLSFQHRRWLASAVKQKKQVPPVHLPETHFASRSSPILTETVLKPQTMGKLYHWNQGRSIPNGSIENLWVFHDGPPYANGDLHIGHALNKILKDIINRYQLINGKKVHYVPGWDCHGLPIELKTLEKLANERRVEEKRLKREIKKNPQLREELEKLRSSKLSSTDIVRLSTEHALKEQQKQSLQFQDMAIMGDFTNPYMTLKKSYIVNQLRIFKKFFDNGMVKRQEKPVYWGCENATALAEGELEYNPNHKSTSAYVSFPISKKNGLLSQFENLKALIWTTTPWTLVSNLAICINDTMDYTVIKYKDSNLIVAQDLVSRLSKEFEFTETDVSFKGSELLDCQYSSPLKKGEFPFLSGSHVTSSAGTGLVHTAPGHGHDDYLACLKNGIKPYSPVDKYGKYTNDVPSSLADLVGKKVLGEGSAMVLEKISQLNMLVKTSEIVHSYPYDWRSKKPIIIRSTPQWFIDVSQIKEETIEALERRVQFFPERGVNRLTSFIRNRNEWCISRQRSWGVPIPVLYHKETGKPLMSDEVIEKLIGIIEAGNVEGWFKYVESNTLPEELAHYAEEYILGTDTMDVWFDSGSSWKIIETYLKEEGVYEQAIERGYLADVYLEGSDQHRGWFQSSLLNKVGSKTPGEPLVLPYNRVITHGFTLDEKGEKMSKSIGNTVSPADIIHGNKNTKIPKIGIDGLRLWVAQSDYRNDVNVGPTILKHVGDNLKKLRFTFKFLLGNVGRDVPMMLYDELNPLDQYMLSRAARLRNSCVQDYENFEYFKVVKKINQFVNVDLSSIYFDARKDALYTDNVSSARRLSTLVAFSEILKVLVSVLAPILPILTQEVWNNMPAFITKGGLLETPFHSGFYTNDSYVRVNSDAEESFATILQFKEDVNKQVQALKESGVLQTSLECEVTISGPVENLDKELIEDVCVVSKVELHPNSEPLSLKVNKSPLHKCSRCWKHNVVVADEDVVEGEMKELLCVRCQSA